MQRLLKKYRWIFLLASILILVGISSFYIFSVKINLKELSQDLIQKYSKLDISFEKINFENVRRVKFENVVWKEKSQHELVKAKEIIVDFSIFNLGKISNIKIDNAVINYDMYNDYKSNIINELTAGNTAGNTKQNNTKDTNKDSDNFINKITITNSKLKFTDFSHDKLITKKLNDVNGLIDFKKDGIKMEIGGKQKEESYKINLNINNGKMENLVLELEKIKINNTLMQYSPTLDLIDYKSGIIDLELEITDGEISGIGSLTGGDIKYVDFKNRISRVNGSIKFGRDFAKIKANGYVEGENIKTDINYQGDNFQIILRSDKINYDIIDNYKIINEMDLPISGTIQNSYMKYDSKDEIIDLKLKSNKMEIFDIEFYDINSDLQIKGSNIEIAKLEFGNKRYFQGDVKFEGDFVDSKLYGDYSIDNFTQENLLDPMDFKGKINYNMDSKKLDLTSYNSDFDLKFNYELDTKNGQVDLNISNEKKLKFKEYEFGIRGNASINFENLKIKNAEFNNIIINNILYEYDIKLDAYIKNKQLTLKKGEIFKGDSHIFLEGKYNINSGEYLTEIKESQLNILEIPENYLKKYPFLEKNKDQSLNFSGEVKGTKLEKFSGILYYNIPNFEYLGKFDDIRGNLNFAYEEDLTISGNSQIRNMKYQNQNIKDLVLDFSYAKEKISIYKFRNNSLGINGIIDIKNKNLDLRYNINNYTLSDLVNLEEYNIKVNSISGRIRDSFESPEISGDIDGILNQNFGSDISLKGNIVYKDQIVSLDKFKLNNNTVNGTINLKNKDIRLRINIFEDNFSNIYETSRLDNINFRILGEIDIWGKLSDLEGVGTLKLDNVFYRDVSIPDLSIEFNYNKGSVNKILEKGIISFSKLALKDNENKDILSGDAFWDLENNNINLNFNDEVDLKELNYPDIYGTITTDIEFQKREERYEYNFEVSSDKFGWGDIQVKNLNSKIKGNNKSIEIQDLKAFYNENKIQIDGGMNLDPLNYDFRVDASKMDMELFSFLLQDYGKDIDGSADINLDINSEDSRGEIKVSNFKITSVDNKFKLSNTDFRLKIDRSKIILESVSGKFNQGNISGNGTIDLEMSELTDMSLNNFDLNISNYNFNTEFKNVKYNIGKYSWVEGDGNLNINSDEISGDIEVTKGNIREIPSFSGEGESLEIDHNINLNINVDREVSITLDDIFSVKTIETNLEGSGTVTNTEGFFNLVGTVSLIDGVLTWNQNDFNIESGVIVFDDPYKEIKNLDPAIAISASTNIVNERIQVDLTGYLKDINIALSSDSGLTYDQIISLLTFHNRLNETTPQGVVKDFLDNQIRNQIFNPISRKIEEILGISNLTIGSELIKKDSEDNLNFTEDLRLGLHISLEQPVYKELLFVNTEIQLSDIEPGEIDSYDVGVRYKMPGNSGVNFGVRNDTMNERVELKLGFEFKKDFLYIKELYQTEEDQNDKKSD